MPASSLSLSLSLSLARERSRSPITRRTLRGSCLARPLPRGPPPSCLPGRKLASHLALIRRAARASHQRGNLFDLSDTIRYIDSLGQQSGEQSSSGSSAADTRHSRAASEAPPPRGQLAVICFTLPLPRVEGGGSHRRIQLRRGACALPPPLPPLSRVIVHPYCDRDSPASPIAPRNRGQLASGRACIISQRASVPR